MLATIPAELLVQAALGASYATLNAGELLLIRTLRLLRCFRLLRLRRILKRLEIKSGLQTSTKTALKFCAIVLQQQAIGRWMGPRLSLGCLSAVSRLSLGYLSAGHRPVDGVSH